jgi:DNA repair protein RadC
MARSTTRCSFCPAVEKKTHKNILMHPLFVEEAVDCLPVDPVSRRQAHALREAIAPYLCLAELRRLATNGDNIQDALKSIEGIPEEVQALVRLLQVLLAPMKDERITRPADLAALLMLEMGGLDHEEFWVACLDTKNHVQRLHCLYKGCLNSSIVRVGELFRLPLQLNSAAIIVAHNHPSSGCQASPEDIEVTKLLIQAGELLEITVLDHLIIGQGAWMSMREQRLGW